MTVLVVDDEPIKRVTLQIDLSEAGYEVIDAADAEIALRLMDSRMPDVVVTDLRMPGRDGIAFLEEIKRRSSDVPVIVMTAYGTVDTAVEAIKRGAYDYITKPFPSERLIEKLDRIHAYRAAGAAVESGDAAGLGRLVGASRGMRLLFDQIRVAAAGGEPVLIFGEAGAGKTSVAEAIHQLGAGRNGRLIRAACETLVDRVPGAETFGGEGGVGSGPADRKPGLIDQAAGGSLLLENIDRLSPAMQARLLQALEMQNAHATEQPALARLLSTTRVALLDLVRRGEFREDLFYRLGARVLSVPSLRDRREDIPALARGFAVKHAALARAAADQAPTISAHAMDALMAYHWPGNVLELEHVIEQALARCDGREIRPEHLPALASARPAGDLDVPMPEVGMGLNQTVADVERMLIEAALRHSAGNQARAAQVLRIPRTTLRDKMTKYGLVGEQPPIAPA